MYINNTQAETIFELVAKQEETLSLGPNRLNFIASREELVELLEKIAPVIKAEGWWDSPEWTAQVHRLCLNNDIAERNANIQAKQNAK